MVYDPIIETDNVGIQKFPSGLHYSRLIQFNTMFILLLKNYTLSLILNTNITFFSLFKVILNLKVDKTSPS